VPACPLLQQADKAQLIGSGRAGYTRVTQPTRQSLPWPPMAWGVSRACPLLRPCRHCPASGLPQPAGAGCSFGSKRASALPIALPSGSGRMACATRGFPMALGGCASIIALIWSPFPHRGRCLRRSSVALPGTRMTQPTGRGLPWPGGQPSLSASAPVPPLPRQAMAMGSPSFPQVTTSHSCRRDPLGSESRVC
jgi:hypothetical protein